MHQAIGERRVEDHCQPVGRYHAAIDDFKTLRRLHPAVRGKNPERGDQRTHGHHHRGKKVQLAPHLVPAKQHHAQETSLEEEGREHFVRQQRPGDGAGEVREAAPIGAKLVGHDQARHHTHAEVDGKDLRPEMVEVTVGVVVGLEPQALQHRKVTGQADGDRREQDVE